MSQNKFVSVEKTHVLVIADVNWGDEMDIGGFDIFTKEEWEEFQTSWKANTDSVEFSIGTNEDLYYNNGEEYLRDVRGKPITKAEADHLRELFAGSRTDRTGVIHWPFNSNDEE